jgi:cytochrome c556
MKKGTLLAAALAGTALLYAVAQTGAQVKGKDRPLTAHQLMEGLVKPQCTALGDALKGSGPADDKAWKSAATHAALLNESAHIMMSDSRCPDAVWAEACKLLDESSKKVLTRIEARDLSGAQEGFAMVTKACGACHAKHKPK